jgi:hydrogenase expression/formation protein HypC
MCLAIPAKICALEAGDMAIVTVENIRKRISVALLDAVAVGDYVLVHVGYALHVLSEQEAAHTLSLMAEAGILQDELTEIGGGP